MKVCTKPGCNEPRWLGPKGNNPYLTMCMEHQRQFWRERAAQHYAIKKGRIAPKPVGRPPRVHQPAELPKVERKQITISKKKSSAPLRKRVKVLVLNRDTRQMIHIEGEIVLDTSLPEHPIDAELLLETYDDYFVVERGHEPAEGLMSLYEGRE